LHFEPERDEEGNVIFEEKNMVKQKRSPLEFVKNYFDDILCATKLQKTYELTTREHFHRLEVAIQRLHFHGAKIAVGKCEFGKSKILFLGWYISHDYIIADPRRIEKIRVFKFPENKKSIRAFLGLVNSLRRVINLEIIREINILTPLTSSAADYEPQDYHREAFEKIKKTY